MDLLLIVLGVAFFAASYGLALVCERLMEG